jgi:hypothetical protein
MFSKVSENLTVDLAEHCHGPRGGKISLLAGIDLLTGAVHALVKDRHRSREFIEFLKVLDAAYPAYPAIKLILDNHSAHISKETKAWLADQPAGLRIHTSRQSTAPGSISSKASSPSSPARCCANIRVEGRPMRIDAAWEELFARRQRTE